MTFAEKAFKFVGKELKSLALSQVRSVAKKKATSVISKFLSKSEEEIHDEATNLLGYETQHYTIKNNEPVFKSSPIFVHEWLTNAPHLVGKIIKDEETDVVFGSEKIVTQCNVRFEIAEACWSHCFLSEKDLVLMLIIVS